jgi:hypothetical protein
MKALFFGSVALFLLGCFGFSNALHLPTVSNSPYSEVILPLYSNDNNDVIGTKLKRSAKHATIEPSAVLPFLPPPTMPAN